MIHQPHRFIELCGPFFFLQVRIDKLPIRVFDVYVNILKCMHSNRFSGVQNFRQVRGFLRSLIYLQCCHPSQSQLRHLPRHLKNSLLLFSSSSLVMDSARFDMIYLSRGSGGAPQSLPTVCNAVPFLLFSCYSLDLSTKSHASGDFRNEQHSCKVDLRNCI